MHEIQEHFRIMDAEQCVQGEGHKCDMRSVTIDGIPVHDGCSRQLHWGCREALSDAVWSWGGQLPKPQAKVVDVLSDSM